MDEQLKQAILQARMQQGLLGGHGGVLDLQPLWQKMNVARNMDPGLGDPLPRYDIWYDQIHRQYPELFGNNPPAPDVNQGQPMVGTPQPGLLDNLRILFGGNAR